MCLFASHWLEPTLLCRLVEVVTKWHLYRFVQQLRFKCVCFPRSAVLYWSPLGSDTHLYHPFFNFFLLKLLSLPLEKIKKLDWNGKMLMRYAFHVLFCFKHCLRFCLAFSLPKARIAGRSCLCIFILGCILTPYLSRFDGGGLVTKLCPAFVTHGL